MIHGNKTRLAYKDRVDYDPRTLRWCLHQLNETDSGTYKLMVMKNDMVATDYHMLEVKGKGFFFCVCKHTAGFLQC